MNKKAELFKAYLEENKITCFTMQEINDERGSVVFRSTISVEGQQLPTIVILDNSFISTVRVFVAANAVREENEKTLLQMINKMNAQQKIMKHYFAEDGSLVIDYTQTSKAEELDAQLMMFVILEVIVKHLEAQYKEIMKQVWA
ncbi:MAG: YbjN domain-containing protein [Phascolarctobacterium sp.]|nr:YbjN domain-containing protein [Phascolarctobacterium sp.]